MIALAILIVTIIGHLKSRKVTQAVKSSITKISHNSYIQNIRKSYKTAVLAITLVTNKMDIQIVQTSIRQPIEIHKILRACKNSTMNTKDDISRTHLGQL